MAPGLVGGTVPVKNKKYYDTKRILKRKTGKIFSVGVGSIGYGRVISGRAAFCGVCGLVCWMDRLTGWEWISKNVTVLVVCV